MKWIDGVVITMTLTAFLLGGIIWLQYKTSLVEGHDYDFRTNSKIVEKNKSFEPTVKRTEQ